MKVLVVIESPGKVKTLSGVLESLEINASVYATHGHLLNNPRTLDPLCIDERFRETHREPIYPPAIQKLKEMADRVDFVIAATDPDQEGDVIAQDVADILADKKVLRAHFQGLDAISVAAGMKAIGLVDQERSWPGAARRILDRLIGSVMAGSDIDIHSGRVQSSLLGFISKKPQPFAMLTLLAPAADGGVPFKTEIPVTWHTREIGEEILKMAGNLQPMEVESEMEVMATTPWNYADILCQAQERLGGRPRDAMKALQELYEGGMLSYLRSDARGVTPDGIACLERLADKHNLKHYFKREKVPPLLPGLAHESPRPLRPYDGDLGLPVKLMEYRDGLMSLVTRNLILSGMPAKKQSANTKGQLPWVNQLNWTRILTPPLPWREPAVEMGLSKIHPEVVAIRAMQDARIARPSTICEHAEKFVSRNLVDPEFRMNEKGRDWMKRIPGVLSNPLNSSSIERYIETAGLPPSAMVEQVIDQLGEEVSARIQQNIRASVTA